VQTGDHREDLVVVSSSLLGASPVEQVWHLAAALGHWAAPAPGRRHRRSWVVTAVLTTAWFGHGLLDLNGVVDLPRPAALAVALLAPLAVSLAAAADSRHVQRALDEAGWEVLRGSGYDPVALTRQVFGNRREPHWWARLHRREPTPGQRVAAVERLGGSAVAPPLYRGRRIRAAVSSSRTCRSAAGRRGHEVHSGSGGSR
jgi:hypothetical protein